MGFRNFPLLSISPHLSALIRSSCWDRAGLKSHQLHKQGPVPGATPGFSTQHIGRATGPRVSERTEIDVTLLGQTKRPQTSCHQCWGTASAAFYTRPGWLADTPKLRPSIGGSNPLLCNRTDVIPSDKGTTCISVEKKKT